MQAPSFDEAISFLIEKMRSPPRRDHEATYGYDFFLPNVVRDYVTKATQDPRAADLPITRDISPPFFDAAWDLCRRGLLRPSVRKMGGQGINDGGYSITLAGKEWLNNADDLHIEAMMPGRLQQMLMGFHKTFGDGYLQRSQEAVRCHSAMAYLACCVMCGAAAESILLRAAISKKGDEESVLATYRASQGRRRLEDMIVGQADKVIAQRFRNLMDILNYRRDDASHGSYSEISEIEAFDALSRLLRLSHFVKDHWNELTT